MLYPIIANVFTFGNTCYNSPMNDGKTPTIFSPEPWARQEDEEDWEYAAFSKFRDTEPLERPTMLASLCEEFHRSPLEIKRVASIHRWHIRISRYDTWLDSSRRRGVISKKREIGRDMVILSHGLMKIAEDGIRKLMDAGTDPSYREAIEMARLSIELQRAGFTMQGVGDNENIHEEIASESPVELIEAAMQVQMIIRRRIENPAEIIDGTVEEV